MELLINPTGTDTGREWIEVVNHGTRVVSLRELHIADALNDAPVQFSGGGGDASTAVVSQLGPGVRAILIQSGDATKNGGISLGGGSLVGTFGTLVSLNNQADVISICVGACATGVVIDRVSWDETLGPGYDGHALSIDDDGRRCPAITPFGDAGSFGTPLAANQPCP